MYFIKLTVQGLHLKWRERKMERKGEFISRIRNSFPCHWLRDSRSKNCRSLKWVTMSGVSFKGLDTSQPVIDGSEELQSYETWHLHESKSLIRWHVVASLVPVGVGGGWIFRVKNHALWLESKFEFGILMWLFICHFFGILRLVGWLVALSEYGHAEKGRKRRNWGLQKWWNSFRCKSREYKPNGNSCIYSELFTLYILCQPPKNESTKSQTTQKEKELEEQEKKSIFRSAREEVPTT